LVGVTMPKHDPRPPRPGWAYACLDDLPLITDDAAKTLPPAPSRPPAAVPTTPPKQDAVASEPAPACPRKKRKSAVAGVGQRARTLVREQLANGPKPGVQITVAAEAAEIPERSLIAAADALGVRTQRGQWWLPR
jgi:hypothetical protein